MPARARFVVEKVALWQVSLPVLQFPLSVSFHQCSILIHTSTTNAVCFSPSTSVSPVSIIPPMLHTHSSIHHRPCMLLLIYSVVKYNYGCSILISASIHQVYLPAGYWSGSGLYFYSGGILFILPSGYLLMADVFVINSVPPMQVPLYYPCEVTTFSPVTDSDVK
jgi:hypothetical protein